MKILLSTHHLVDEQGTEVFAYTVAKFLKRAGHAVTVHSSYLGDGSHAIADMGVCVVDDLRELASRDFDVAHVHHNINALEVRVTFPELPIVFVSHGVVPHLEQPPPLNMGIGQYVAVSEEVRDNLLSHGVGNDLIHIIRNPVDDALFSCRQRIAARPRRLLVLSNRLGPDQAATVRSVCVDLGISCTLVGEHFGVLPNTALPRVIENHDVVMSLGRGAVESMMCGRIPVVFGADVGDGLVTPGNFTELASRNFSGRTHNRALSREALGEAVLGYRQHYGEQLRSLALEHYSASVQVHSLVAVYALCAAQRPRAMSQAELRLAMSFCKAVEVTRAYADYACRKRMMRSSEWAAVKRLRRFRLALAPTASWRERWLRGLWSSRVRRT